MTHLSQIKFPLSKLGALHLFTQARQKYRQALVYTPPHPDSNKTLVEGTLLFQFLPI